MQIQIGRFKWKRRQNVGGIFPKKAEITFCWFIFDENSIENKYLSNDLLFIVSLNINFHVFDWILCFLRSILLKQKNLKNFSESH